MSNERYIIHIDSGKEYRAEDERGRRLLAKLVSTGRYMWNDEQLEVSPATAVKIIEAERIALVKEREAFELEKKQFEQLKKKK